MGVFDTAMKTLMRDPNMAEDVVYTPSAGSPVTVRGVFKSPDQIAEWQDVRTIVPTHVLDILVADVAAPAKGDRIEARSGTFEIVAKPRANASRTFWTCMLKAV